MVSQTSATSGQTVSYVDLLSEKFKFCWKQYVKQDVSLSDGGVDVDFTLRAFNYGAQGKY